MMAKSSSSARMDESYEHRVSTVNIIVRPR